MFRPGVNNSRIVTANVLSVLLCAGVVGLCSLRGSGQPQASASQSEAAPEPWQKEFDEVCSKTQDAMTLSPAELTDLIRRCDALVPQIEKLNESRKKVYMRRLQMCRGVYAYVLDAGKNEKK